MLPKIKVGGPRVLGGSRQTFALVASQYNPELVQGLVDNTAMELMRVMPAARVILQQVPGAFEIPLVVQELANQSKEPGNEVHAIIALGVIIQGDTDHAEHLGRVVTDALQQIALATRVPVIHQVLSCKDEAQAKVRCLDPEHNRGIEAAHAAINIAGLIAHLRE